MALLICPLARFCFPATGTATVTATHQTGRRGGAVFFLLVTAIVFNSFVTVGVEAVGIEFLRTMGMDLTEAVAIVALLVVFKVGGRVIDLLVGRRWEDYISGLSQVR
ncbi:hypothetical protein A4G21_08120 [Brucella intermedia]|nr:hypothetical protein A4G21_08120 [Brucella intermedia]